MTSSKVRALTLSDHPTKICEAFVGVARTHPRIIESFGKKKSRLSQTRARFVRHSPRPPRLGPPSDP